jgi:ATP-dependent protease ClpP protease subunit
MAEKKENEIYLMSPIFDQTATDYCMALDLIPKNEDVTTIMNCPGGSVFAGWTMIGRIQERTGKMNVKVYGHAASMAMFFLLFCDNVEALEVTRFLIHRASGYVENEDDQKNLDSINSDLRKHIESKLDIDALKKITGLSMTDIFDGEKVKDVWITAKEAKKIGLIDKVIRLSKDEEKAYNEKFVALNSSRGSDEGEQGSKPNVIENNNPQKTVKKMTKDELKASSPEVYNAIVAEGKTEGIKDERNRAKSWLAFIDIDKENVMKAVKEGEEFTSAVMAEMAVKMNSVKTAEAIKKDSPEAVKTGEIKTEKTAAEKAVEAFEKEVSDNLKKSKIV